MSTPLSRAMDQMAEADQLREENIRLQAKIELLKDEVKVKERSRLAFSLELERRTAEVERLKAELRRVNEDALDQVRDECNARAQAEAKLAEEKVVALNNLAHIAAQRDAAEANLELVVEALKAENERIRANTLPDVVPEDVDAFRAEIERLKAADAAADYQIGKMREEIERLRAEIEAHDVERQQVEAEAKAELERVVVEEAAHLAWKTLHDMKEDAAASVVSEKIRAAAKGEK